MTSDTFTANPLKTASSSEAAAAASSLKIQRFRRRRMLTRLGCLIGLVVLFCRALPVCLRESEVFQLCHEHPSAAPDCAADGRHGHFCGSHHFPNDHPQQHCHAVPSRMNSLYLLIHTGVVFFLGSGSEFATNRSMPSQLTSS